MDANTRRFPSALPVSAESLALSVNRIVLGKIPPPLPFNTTVVTGCDASSKITEPSPNVFVQLLVSVLPAGKHVVGNYPG